MLAAWLMQIRIWDSGRRVFKLFRTEFRPVFDSQNTSFVSLSYPPYSISPAAFGNLQCNRYCQTMSHCEPQTDMSVLLWHLRDSRIVVPVSSCARRIADAAVNAPKKLWSWLSTSICSTFRSPSTSCTAHEVTTIPSLFMIK